MKKMNKKGFTLVEIMIVVAIIGLLAAIGIPSFQKARTSSQKNACINNLRIIDGAKEQAALENKSTTVDATQVQSFIKGGVNGTVCPSDTDDAKDMTTSYTIGDLETNPSCAVVGTVGHTL